MWYQTTCPFFNIAFALFPWCRGVNCTSVPEFLKRSLKQKKNIITTSAISWPWLVLRYFGKDALWGNRRVWDGLDLIIPNRYYYLLYTRQIITKNSTAKCKICNIHNRHLLECKKNQISHFGVPLVPSMFPRFPHIAYVLILFPTCIDTFWQQFWTCAKLWCS